MSPFEVWWDSDPLYEHLTGDPETEAARAAWDAAIEQAAQLMLAQKVSASDFYATELRKLKEPA